MIKTAFCLILTMVLVMSIFGQTESEKVQKMSQLFVSSYNAKEYAQIDAEFNAQMKAAVPTDKLTEFLDGLHKNLGKIIKLGSPDFAAPTVADFSIEFERGKRILLIALDADGKIGGLRVSPPPAEKPKNASRNQTKMILPFKGEWLVFWGGDTPEKNYHQDAPNQRFAFDILKTDAGGKTHTGSGSKNEDYYAFGQEIIAPADGVVTYVVDGIHDNKPGEMNRMFVPGNLVIIKHAENEYSLLAHFKQNSIKVKIGDKVKQGQTLGLCGNSGNSSEAHLHFQVQNTSFFENEASMKVFFESVVVKQSGKSEIYDNYSPEKGNVVSNKLNN